MSEIVSILNDIMAEIRIIRMKVEAIEERLGEYMNSEDKEALEEALKDYKEGQYFSLEEVEKEVEAEG